MGEASRKAAEADVLLRANLQAGIVPSAAWLERAKLVHQAAKEAGVEPLPIPQTDADRDVAFFLLLDWLIPMRTADKSPQVTVPMAEIYRVPLLKVKKSVRDRLMQDGHPGIAATIKLDSDGQADS